jgi:uncharacterized membrane protein
MRRGGTVAQDKIERHHRSLIKTISWRVIATIATMLIVYIFTGELILTLGVGAVEVISKMILYYFHERIWNLITWGKWHHPLSDFDIKGEVDESDKEIIRHKLREMGYID